MTGKIVSSKINLEVIGYAFFKAYSYATQEQKCYESEKGDM